MTNGINTRELILQILLEIEEEGKHSHIAIRNALSKYQFLPRQERAFITRVCEGTLEYRILIDYIIDSYSKVTVDKMKPVIREILRSAVYQIRFMDSVPDSAVCNEAVKLAQRKGFYSLKPFVNGVLRTIAREWKNLKFPSREENLVRYLSVRYSMPETLVNRWLADYGEEKTEKILADYFYRNNIPYKYECPLKLKGYGVVYPDFTFLSKKTGKEIYWEHDGMMDDTIYVQNAIKKIEAYEKNDIFPGERLILTFETSQSVLRNDIIETMVEKYIL